MQITKPTFYKEFSCIAGACPDTCCAGWQIMIDEKSLQKYRRFKGPFRNRLHNDIDWKEHSFCQYDKRCAFLNEDNLCDIYSEAGKDMLCDTCRKYPRHIEEFEGLREYSLSLSCPEAARIFLSHKEKITFFTREVAAPEETFDDFDYFLFTALMDTRDYLFSVIQDRSIPVRLRRQKLLACAHDFQLSLDKNELFQWEDICGRHQKSGYGEKFLNKIQKWNDECQVTSEQPCKDSTADTASLLALSKQIWCTVIPQMEVLRQAGIHTFGKPSFHFMISAKVIRNLQKFMPPSRTIIQTGRFTKNSFSSTGSIPTSVGLFMTIRSLPKQKWLSSAPS